MELVTCPHCNVRVAAMSDGKCPSCRLLIAATSDTAIDVSESNSSNVEGLGNTRPLPSECRPTSITVIAWILIVISVLNLVTGMVNMNNPMVRELMAKSPIPIPLQFTMLYLGLTITLACGVAILKGHNWGRWLYVIWNSVGAAIGLATSPMKAMMLPGLVFVFIVAFFLFRPNATHYFMQSGATDEQAV